MRIAVIGVTEPFAAFADGPVARAVAGAAHLDTLVVVPAGNEGPAGPGYGSIGGPVLAHWRHRTFSPRSSAYRRRSRSSSAL